MKIELELTSDEAAGLAHVAAKFNAEAQARLPEDQRAGYQPVAEADYLARRVRDVLASYRSEIVRDRENANRALITAALALPQADRDEITALIQSKLNP